MLMHESEKRGALVLNGSPMPRASIARVLGIPLGRLNACIDVLLDTGVASLDETGAIICRRMLRDQEKRIEQVEAGKRGGNPALKGEYNTPGFVYAIQRASDLQVKIGVSVNPQKRLYRLRYESKGDTLEILATRQVDNMGSSEAELHHKYAAFASGEWFALPEELVKELISALKGKPKGNDNEKQTPSSSSSLSTTKPEKQKRAPSAFSLPPWISQVTWDGFEETRRRMRKPMTDAARALIIKRLDKFRQDGQDPEAMVENAIAHGWISVWPIEEGRNGTEVNRSGKDYQGNSSNGDDAGSEDRSGLFEALYGKTG